LSLKLLETISVKRRIGLASLLILSVLFTTVSATQALEMRAVHSTGSSALPEALLYKANVNFYGVNGVKKIDVDIGNSGTSDTMITRFYVGTSSSTLQNQTIAPAPLQAGWIQRVTIDYEWTAGVTYYFKVLCISGQSLDFSEQASSSVPEGNDNVAVVRFEPENVTVGEGDVFNVSVLIENIPADLGMAGVEFRITWNPTVLNAIDMTEVMFHSVTPQDEWGNIWRCVDRINNTEGSVWYAYLWQDWSRAKNGGYWHIYGNNTLATITLKAVGAGSAALHFSVMKVADPDAEPLIYRDEWGYGGDHTSILKNVIVDCDVNVEKAGEQGSDSHAQSSEGKSNDVGLSIPTPSMIQWQGMVQIMGMFVAFGGVIGTAFMLISHSYLVRQRRKKET
jgi:hypothetical protein